MTLVVTAVVVSLAGVTFHTTGVKYTNRNGAGSIGTVTRSMRVVCAMVSAITLMTRLTTRFDVSAPHSSRMLSPLRTLVAVPRTVTDWISAVGGGCFWSCTGFIAFHSG